MTAAWFRCLSVLSCAWLGLAVPALPAAAQQSAAEDAPSLAAQLQDLQDRYRSSLASGKGKDALAAARRRVAATFARMSPAEWVANDVQVLAWARTVLWMGDASACRAALDQLEAAYVGAEGVSADRRQMAALWYAKSFFDEGDYRAALPRLQEVDAHVARERDEADATRLFVRQLRVEALQCLGKTREALELHERVMAVHRRLLPEHPRRSVEAEQWLGILRHYSGDRQGAFAAYERFHDGVLEYMPEDAAMVASAQQALASAMSMLHDHRGALELLRKAVATNSERLPATSFELLRDRMGIAKLLQQLGDHDATVTLLDQIWPDIQAAEAGPTRDRLAANWHRSRAKVCHRLLDFANAGQHAKQALQWLVANRSSDDRDLNECRMLLASVQTKAGDYEAAAETLERAFVDLGRRYPIDHSFMKVLVGQLVTAHRLQRNWERSLAMASKLFEATVQALTKCVLASRPAGALAQRQRGTLGCLVDLLLDDMPDAQRSQVAGMALVTSQLRLGLETRVARAAGQGRRSQRGEARKAGAELRRVVSEIQAASGRSGEDKSGGVAALTELVRERERLERQLVQMSRSVGTPSLPTLAELAAELEPDSAAVAIMHVGRTIDLGEGLGTYGWLVGFVLRPSGQTQLVDLGAARPAYRFAQEVGAGSREKLRQRIVDPILAKLAGIDSMVLAVDRRLQLVPFDALPTDAGEPLGSKLRIQRVASLLDLLVQEPDLPPTPQLVAVGGVDYDSDAESASDVAFPLASAAAPTLQRGSSGRSYAPLPGTLRELAELVRSFGRAFPEGTVDRLEGGAATKSALLARVPEASIVHLATHGFCALKATARSALDPTASAVALTPYAYSGLALSGANLPPAGDGSLPGVLTAEELRQFDFFDAYLVVLSACDSARGLESNLSHASLHAALHGAGARFIVSSRWKVGDRAAEQVMADFYQELWRRPEDPHGALWAAKLKARSAGMSFRDWAGFLITGR